MSLTHDIIQSFRNLGRGTDELSVLQDRIKAQGYQVTVLQNCDSIYLADPSGIGAIFDTRTGLEILRKLDTFFTHIHKL